MYSFEIPLPNKRIFLMIRLVHNRNSTTQILSHHPSMGQILSKFHYPFMKYHLKQPEITLFFEIPLPKNRNSTGHLIFSKLSSRFHYPKFEIPLVIISKFHYPLFRNSTTLKNDFLNTHNIGNQIIIIIISACLKL